MQGDDLILLDMRLATGDAEPVTLAAFVAASYDAPLSKADLAEIAGLRAIQPGETAHVPVHGQWCGVRRIS